jgi:DNA invertase Pin-like site-specific DNA recombinase
MSQDRTGESLGVERQREDCEKLVAARGWVMAHPPFVENDTSASGRKPRPKFRALLAAVAAGSVDVIVAWALDRLTRNARDRLALVETCRDHGVRIALVRGSDLDPTTPSGRMLIGLLGEVAQAEIETKSDRQSRAAEQAAELGIWIGGRRPFGYESDGVTIIEREADAIRAGYAALLSGVGLRGIANEWNSMGLRTGQAPWRRTHLGEKSPWRGDSVRRVLINPRYAGIRAFRGEEKGEACWDGIVGIDTYRAAKALLNSPTRNRGGAGVAARQFLTGLALCGLDGCGYPVHGGGAKHGKSIYRCRTSTLLPHERPNLPGTHVNRLAGPVDDYVMRIVVARLSRPDARELLIDHRRSNVSALRDEANALRARLEAMAAEFGADPDTSPVEYRAMRFPVRARVAEIEAQIADAGRVDLLGPLVQADDVSAAWAALNVERRRAVVDALMIVRLQAVGRGVRTFRPETVEVEWKTDL